MTDDADELAGRHRVGEQPAGVGVDGEVLHGAVAAGHEDRGVVREIDVGDGDGGLQLGLVDGDVVGAVHAGAPGARPAGLAGG